MIGYLPAYINAIKAWVLLFDQPTDTLDQLQLASSDSARLEILRDILALEAQLISHGVLITKDICEEDIGLRANVIEKDRICFVTRPGGQGIVDDAGMISPAVRWAACHCHGDGFMRIWTERLIPQADDAWNAFLANSFEDFENGSRVSSPTEPLS